MRLLRQIIVALHFCWRWIVLKLSYDFSLPTERAETARLPLNQHLYTSTVYILKPATQVYCYAGGVEKVQSGRPGPERHVRGTTELSRQMMTCSHCGAEIDYCAPASPCARCQCESIQVTVCTCLYIPTDTLTMVIHSKTYRSDEIRIRNKTCPLHGR